MDLSGNNVYNVVVSGSAEQKHALLHDLKTHVKKDNVQLTWVGKYFEALSIATDSSDASFQTLAFSLVCHLVKRVSIQDIRGTVLRDHSVVVLPLLIPRIADPRSSIKVAAKRALEAYWLSTPKSVENAMIDSGLANRNSLLVNECVAWLNYIFTTVSPHFKLDAFLDPLARILCQHAADEKLMLNIKILLDNYYDLKQNRIRKFDLQKALERNNVPATIRTSIMGTDSIIARTSESLNFPKIGSDLLKNPAPKSTVQRPTQASPPPYNERSLTSSVRSLDSRIVTASQATSVPQASSISNDSTGEPGVCSNPELRAFLTKLPNYSYDNTMKPHDVSDGNEIYQIVSGMSEYFASKETERNWSSREKSILKLRSLIRGNATTDFLADLSSSIKDLHEGICKSLSSLRTTLSVNSCQLVKEMAFLFRNNFEPLAELFVPTLIKLCSNTKHLTNINAHVAICAILAQCTLTTKLAQRILNAASEKSVNTKAFASSWLQIFMIRTHDSWKDSGSEIAERVLLKLLPDPNMQVRSAAKDAYWKYCEYAPESALDLRSQLDSNINRALERSRPKGLAVPSLPTLTAPKVRPSLKESILAKKKELKSKQSVSRSASRNDFSHPSVALNEKSSIPIPRRYSITPSVEEHSRSHVSDPALHKRESKSFFDRLVDKETAKSEKSAMSSPEGSDKKYTRPYVSPKSTFEPHYAQSTFSHPSTSMSQVRSQTDSNADHPMDVSFPDHTIPNHHSTNSQNSLLHGPRLDDGQPASNDQTEESLIKLLASSDEKLINEGISLLRQVILSGETLPEKVAPRLKKLSVTNPAILKPLFEVNETIMRKVWKLFSKEDFLRSSCILITPTEESLDLIITLFTADELYNSVENMLSYVLELTDIVDDGLLVMQLIKFKDRILTMVLRMLTNAVSKVPITDVTLSKLTNNLFELVPVVHQTNLMSDYKVLLCKLYAINSKLFVSQLSVTTESNKQEIELLVGIDDSLEFKNTEATLFNMTEFTRISPGKNLEQLSPLKFPSDFTMLLPNNKLKPEPKPFLGESNVEFNESSVVNKSAGSIDEQRICLEEPPQMEMVSEEDIMMEDPDRSWPKSHFEDEAMDESTEPELAHNGVHVGGLTGIKLEAMDFNILQKSDSNSPRGGLVIKDGSQELAEDLASVRLSSQSNSIETFIERVDPLNKLSSRNRPISIFEDSKAGSPQKVREYDSSELNWFNFLMAKMSLDYGLDDLERYSKNDFRSLCQQLSNGSANETSLATMMKYLRVPDPESLTPFLKKEGYSLVEDAAMEYLRHESSNLVGGLMILKQLLVNRFRLDIIRLWRMLIDLSGFDSVEPLRTLDLAISETFDEVLCGMYTSKELLQVVVDDVDEGLNEGALQFVLECLYKLISMETLVLSIDEKLVLKVDRAIRKFMSHKKANVRKVVIETYGRMYRAARISEVSGSNAMVSTSGNSSHEAMVGIMMQLSIPQQRIIEYFSQEH